MIGLFQKSCYFRLSNLRRPHDAADKKNPVSPKHKHFFHFIRKVLWTTTTVAAAAAATTTKKAFGYVHKMTDRAARLWCDGGGGGGSGLVATTGLQPHSFSAQWAVQWRVEVGPNQNRGAHDLIFCFINTFLFGSGAMCHAAAAAAAVAVAAAAVAIIM